MMKKYLFLLLLIWSGISIYAQSPKREFRSVWFQTVYRGDWPTTVITSPGNESQIAAQKSEFINKLDRLKAANVNTICFQARSRSDAMYKSSYEPWSQDLVSIRGMEPGYDPLEFVVEECHKRGIECHVWINPYRYESSVSQTPWNNHELDYRNSHPEWVLQVGDKSILDPGLPEVRTQITNIIKEIVENYDIDGVLFDDYFYLEGTNTEDADTQAKYNTTGLAVADWRRANVNKLIEDIYNMIEETKPYVRFGIGPAGIWGGNAAAQAKYGVTNPPNTNSGYAFNSIYCDPVAWLYEGTIDYITPQIYWATSNYGYSDRDYGVLCPWWSEVANKFGKHMYVSQSASQINSNRWPYKEEVHYQVELSRESNRDNAPGQVYFNYSAFASKHAGENQTLINYFENNIYTKPALAPAINRKVYEEKRSPINIQLEGTTLTWEAPDECRRYSVYAIPNEIADKRGNFSGSDYLLGISYEKSFDLSGFSEISNYKYGVACLDDYGNEFAPALMDYTPVANQPATLISPLDEELTFNPTYFIWSEVENAEYYVLEISTQADFSSIFYRRDISDNMFLSSDVPVEIGATYYWRVRTRSIGVADEISNSRSLILKDIEITSPAAGETGISLSPSVSWEDAGEGFTYILQLSGTSSFTSVTEFANIQTNSITLPLGSVYAYSTYYVRVKGVREDYETGWSEGVRFNTVEQAPEIPEILSPTEGEIISADVLIKWSEDPYANQFYLQISPVNTFAATNDRISKYISGFEYQNEIASDDLQYNTTYYARIRAHYSSSSRTDWSPVISFLHVGTTGIGEDNYNGYDLISPTVLNSDYVYITFKLPKSQFTNLYLCDTTGKKVSIVYTGQGNEGENQVILNAGTLDKGLYLLVMETPEVKKVLKLVK